MAKKIVNVIKLQIEAGKANPAPPVGTALGPAGINIMDFCKQFNEKTANDKGTITPAVISVYEDRSFSFILKTPPVSTLIKKALNLSKGSGEPNKKKVAELTQSQIKQIAETKIQDLNANDIEAAKKIIAGSARSMGITVAQ